MRTHFASLQTFFSKQKQKQQIQFKPVSTVKNVQDIPDMIRLRLFLRIREMITALKTGEVSFSYF